MAATARLEPRRFLTSLVLNRDDSHAVRVYGDWLEQQGDPRGELIALQQMVDTTLDDLDLRHYIASYLWRHRSLVPTIDPWRAQFTWKWGFIVSAHLDRPTINEIERLVSHPSCVLLDLVTVTRPQPGVRQRMEALPHIALRIEP